MYQWAASFEPFGTSIRVRPPLCTTITPAESWRLQLVLLLMRLLFSGRFVSPPQPPIQRGLNQDAHAQSPTRNEMEIVPCALGMARH
jgi:hypothetical protein